MDSAGLYRFGDSENWLWVAFSWSDSETGTFRNFSVCISWFYSKKLGFTVPGNGI
jgi:hypothetical protein